MTSTQITRQRKTLLAIGFDVDCDGTGTIFQQVSPAEAVEIRATGRVGFYDLDEIVDRADWERRYFHLDEDEGGFSAFERDFYSREGYITVNTYR